MHTIRINSLLKQTSKLSAKDLHNCFNSVSPNRVSVLSVRHHLLSVSDVCKKENTLVTVSNNVVVLRHSLDWFTNTSTTQFITHTFLAFYTTQAIVMVRIHCTVSSFDSLFRRHIRCFFFYQLCLLYHIYSHCIIVTCEKWNIDCLNLHHPLFFALNTNNHILIKLKHKVKTKLHL